MAADRELRELAELIGRQAAGLDVWEDAELCVLEVCLRERLAVLGIKATPELAAGLMAAAQLLAERSPEWGGRRPGHPGRGCHTRPADAGRGGLALR